MKDHLPEIAAQAEQTVLEVESIFAREDHHAEFLKSLVGLTQRLITNGTQAWDFHCKVVDVYQPGVEFFSPGGDLPARDK